MNDQRTQMFLIAFSVFLLICASIAISSILYAYSSPPRWESIVYITIINVVLFMPAIHKLTLLLWAEKSDWEIQERPTATLDSGNPNKGIWAARLFLLLFLAVSSAGAVICAYATLSPSLFGAFPPIAQWSLKAASAALMLGCMYVAGVLFLCVLIEVRKFWRFMYSSLFGKT